MSAVCSSIPASVEILISPPPPGNTRHAQERFAETTATCALSFRTHGVCAELCGGACVDGARPSLPPASRRGRALPQHEKETSRDVEARARHRDRAKTTFYERDRDSRAGGVQLYAHVLHARDDRRGLCCHRTRRRPDQPHRGTRPPLNGDSAPHASASCQQRVPSATSPGSLTLKWRMTVQYSMSMR